jgi:phenylacetate-CoA ligase
MIPLPVAHADLKKPVYVAWGRFLREAESWTREQIADYQLHEVQRVVRHAHEHTGAYRELFDQSGLTPAAIRTLDDLQKFPFVEKEMIRDRLEDFSVPMADRTYVTTGGSTGIPFGMYRDPEAFPKELASKAHQYHRVGWREGDRQIVLRGLPIDTPDHTVLVPEFNELRCSSYHLTPEWMEVYRQRAWEYQPEWIRCYPSSGCIFARWLKDTGHAFPPVKGILCASENLYDFQKELLEGVFGARVFSHYGHYELAVLAGFCEYEDAYHVLPQYGYAELIGPNGRPVTKPGQMGEIVGTSFIMHATPFIRYRTRDFAALKGWECPSCGRPYQVWERIEGRLQEFIVAGTGRLISMTAINFHDDIFDHIQQFQFYQGTKGKVVFRYIPKPTCDETILQDVRRRLMVKLGDDVELTFQPVDEIPLTPRGKHRFLIQKLSVEYHDE